MRRRWSIVLGSLLVTLAVGAQAAGTPPSKVAVTDSWLGGLTAFMGGPFLEISPLEHWSADLKSARRRWDGKTPILALDLAQAREFRLTSKAGTLLPNVHLLYQKRPQSFSDEDFYLDPARLPFVAQRIMIVLTALEPNRYVFFQRRLAEFETRLTSTVLSGRKQLEGFNIWDPGGAYSQFWKAVGCRVNCSGAKAQEALGAWASHSESTRNKMSPPWQGATLVVDWRVPKQLRDRLVNAPGVVFLTPVTGAQPLFELHDIFLDVSLGGKPRPAKIK